MKHWSAHGDSAYLQLEHGVNIKSNYPVDSAKTDTKLDSENGVPDKLVRRGGGWLGKLLGGTSSKGAKSESELRESTSDDVLGSSPRETSALGDMSESLVLDPTLQEQNAVRKGYLGMGIPRQNIGFLPSSRNDVVIDVKLDRHIPENRRS